jgi:hypothetical protein
LGGLGQEGEGGVTVESGWIEWTTNLADHIFQTLRKWGADHCPVCGFNNLEMVQGF